jgi:plasmid maintenance system antidote protein VapI
MGCARIRLARDIDVNPARVNDIVHGGSVVTASIAPYRGEHFGTMPQLWRNLLSDAEELEIGSGVLTLPRERSAIRE